MEENQNVVNNDILTDRTDTAFEYILSKDEVRSALYLTGKLKNRKKRSIVEVVVAAVIFVISLINVILDPSYGVGYIVMVAMIVVIFTVLLVPKKEEERTVTAAMKTTDAKTIVTPLENKLRIRVPKSGANWEIIPEMVKGSLSNDIIHIILLKDTRFVVIPKRVLDTEKKKAAFLATKDHLTKPHVD